MKTAALSLCAGAVLAAGCESVTTSTRACTPNYVFGLHVDVVDSLTTAPPASALLIARSGAFVDSVGPEPSKLSYEGGPTYLRLYAAGERTGTYDLTVRAPGYRDWTRTGVRVTGDECHAHPTTLTARLQH
jgi:hypothetical protein